MRAMRLGTFPSGGFGGGRFPLLQGSWGPNRVNLNTFLCRLAENTIFLSIFASSKRQVNETLSEIIAYEPYRFLMGRHLPELVLALVQRSHPELSLAV